MEEQFHLSDKELPLFYEDAASFRNIRDMGALLQDIFSETKSILTIEGASLL